MFSYLAIDKKIILLKNKNVYACIFFQTKADGSVLFEQVCKQLNLLEADYFGLEYQEGSTKV